MGSSKTLNSDQENDKDVITAISNGAGLIHMSGHGNPAYWGNFLPDAETEAGMVDGLLLNDMIKLTNKEKLPIITVGGCHNALFNISMFQILKNRADHYNYYWMWQPFPVCFCWGMVIKPNGGAIGVIGGTGYGPAQSGNPNVLIGAIDLNFWYRIGQGDDTPGMAHGGAILKYIEDFEIKKREAFSITIFALLGDPSLKFGGY